MNRPFERDPYTPEETKLWYRWQFNSLKANEGVPHWIPSNFESDHGRVHNLAVYTGRVAWLGSIHQEYGWGCEVYHNVEGKPIKVYETPALEDAKEYLIKLVEEQR